MSLQANDSAIVGQFPPTEIQQKVRPLLKKIRVAQEQKDLQQITLLRQQIVTHLGPWAGNQSNRPLYYSVKQAGLPDAEKVYQLWHKVDKKIRKNVLWVKVPDGNPAKMNHGLRQAARPIMGFANLYQIPAYKTKETLNFVIKGADYLMSVQRPNGLFPSPDLRGDDENYTIFNKRALRKNPKALIDGWFVDDYRGELQFDHGASGVAMLRAYQLTQDDRYLQSAKLAANWAKNKPLDTNWSYNAFSVWFLAESYAVTGEKYYLDAALEKLTLGVLPGQLKNGRWFDPINSQLVFHAMNVRAMMAVYTHLPTQHPLKTSLKNSIISGLNNAATQIQTNGASSVTTSTAMFVEAIDLLGENNAWRSALQININAGLEAFNDRKAPAVGIFLPVYLKSISQAKKP
jgi:hypothetical protein